METVELLKKKNQALKYFEKYKKLKAEVDTNCTHPLEYLVAEEKYFSGGYDYYEETHYWDKCTICSTRINKWKKVGASYQ